MKKFRTLAVAMVLAVSGTVALAPLASANTVEEDGYSSTVLYHNGAASQGSITVRAKVEIFYDNNDNLTKVRGFGMVTKGYKALRAQIDRVDLLDNFGRWQTAGVPVNSGTAASVKKYTAWAPAESYYDTPCEPGSYTQVRVYFSTRWADGSLTKGNFLSDVGYTSVCRK